MGARVHPRLVSPIFLERSSLRCAFLRIESVIFFGGGLERRGGGGAGGLEREEGAWRGKVKIKSRTIQNGEGGAPAPTFV